MIDFARVRRMMIDNQLRTYDITDLGIMSTMNEVPRERFVPDALRDLSYTDRSLEVAGPESAEGARHLLPPMIFARLLQNLSIRHGEKVLVVGGGLGYEAVVIARQGARVVVREPDPALAERTRANLAEHGADAVVVSVGPMAEGCPEEAPFDAILVNGAVEVRPQALLEQLANGGRLGAIVGDGSRTSRASVFVRSHEAFGARAVFDAAAPVLAPFREVPGFVF